ncbi:hypothetical protein SAMN04487905_1276 [Actinopolyspora xinjiangensis]|uniref:Uncharacterized protein n=1 Tax=Actinopolyspora xinjiangensis TaxID=405564 RepID=A0A1H0X3D6_9ACTN|nr:hypothetical protein SAMN04487905_1276 [Actinopolyspora xinjiangensis]
MNGAESVVIYVMHWSMADFLLFSGVNTIIKVSFEMKRSLTANVAK